MYGQNTKKFFNTALVSLRQGQLSEQSNEIENCLKFYRQATEMAISILGTEFDPRVAFFAQKMIRMCIKFEKFDQSNKYLNICQEIYKKFNAKDIDAEIKYSQGLIFK